MRARITPSNACYTGDRQLAGSTGKDGKRDTRPTWDQEVTLSWIV